jgi:hypothetical protein
MLRVAHFPCANGPMSYARKKRPVGLSIGILACNKESSPEPMLSSLFRQSVFERLAARHERCEIIMLGDACNDRTAPGLRDFLARMQLEHPWASTWAAHVIEVPDEGYNKAWNRFIHEFSAVEATYLATMHTEILLHHRDAVSSLICALERRRHLGAACGRRCEHVLFKERKTFWERLALTSVPADGNGGGQLNGELVCLRASVARRIHLPSGLDAGFDRFVTQVIGTDFFSRRFDPMRFALPPDAAHICVAPTRPREVLEFRKRRMIGETAAQVLLDYLGSRPPRERSNLLETFRAHEAFDVQWLEKLVAVHVRRRSYFGQLFSGVLRMRRNTLPAWRRVRQIPEACTGFLFTVIACLRAHRFLRVRPAARMELRTSEVVLSDTRSGTP